MAEIQKNYKDTVFRMIFREKDKLLTLYNAVNGTHYNEPEELEITTLENAVYMNMKNDISFVLDFSLNLYEHQSTVNPNMPLRDLFYLSKTLQNLTKDEDLHSSRQIYIPMPQFALFYNGADKQPEQWELKLSDAYKKPAGREEVPSMLELTVKAYNVNYGKNRKLMEACRTLEEYAIYVSKIRKYAKIMPIEEAVERAVTECINEGILADFLRKNRAEAIEMSLYEYNEEFHIKNERRIAFEEGEEKQRKKAEKEVKEQRQIAEQQTQRAEKAEKEAEEQRQRAEQQTQIAEQQTQRAERAEEKIKRLQEEILQLKQGDDNSKRIL